ncbi:MAG: cytochrome c family protein [Phycisphaerales bacterium]
MPTTPTRTPKREKERVRTDTLTVFLTGNVLGELKPCGCSGGQLGGFDRRSTVLNSVSGQRRLVVDTGSFVKSDAEQDLIKYNIIIQALELLDYDLVSLSEKDIEIGNNLGVLDGIESVFNIISPAGTADRSLPARFTKELSLKGRTVSVTVAAFNAKSVPIEQVRELFATPSGVQTLDILILNHCDPGIIDFIAGSVPLVDCIICPAESDEPMIIGDPNKRPLAFSVGRFGRYICRLQVTAPARAGERLKLTFHAVAVEEDLPQDGSLVRLYEDYQQIVRDRNLLEKHPRFRLPNGLQYSGSRSCKPCHTYEYEKWSGNAHGRAFATLERVGSQFDPECVVCHVVGMDYESGFISQEQTGHLKNVGCENCHGPGSEHIKTAGATELAEPKSACIDCHTPEHSGDYAGNERSFLEKIVHWREPNAASDVK